MAIQAAPAITQDMFWNNRLSQRWTPGKYIDGLLNGNEVTLSGNGAVITKAFNMVITNRISDKDISRAFAPSANADLYLVTNTAFGSINTFKIVPNLYTVSRQRATKWVIPDDMIQFFAGNFGYNRLMVVDRAIELWKAETLWKDIDRYVLFAMLCGRMTGKYVQASDGVFTQDGSWVEQQGTDLTSVIAPSFAPIQGFEIVPGGFGAGYEFLSILETYWTYLHVDNFAPSQNDGQSSTDHHLANNVSSYKNNTTILFDSKYEKAFRDSVLGLGLPDASGRYFNILETGDLKPILGWTFRFAPIEDRLPVLVVEDTTLLVDPIQTAEAQANGFTPAAGFTARKPIGVCVFSGSGQYFEFFSRLSTKRPWDNANMTSSGITDIAYEIFFDVIVLQQFSAGIMPLFAPAAGGLTPVDISGFKGYDATTGEFNNPFVDPTLEFDWLVTDTAATPNKSAGVNFTPHTAADVAANGTLTANADRQSYDTQAQQGALAGAVDETFIEPTATNIDTF